ncbi:hypothetical protein C1645_882668 [Glomus cerebriforme]|uniref:Transmembrane protein n=1 Tax=Glomus cerebriforme TaxID=658196 RepID=A0A397S0I5_9GLOM|nr:hypothetical protein C1645_882668 [Glomus cerebriforme]
MDVPRLYGLCGRSKMLSFCFASFVLSPHCLLNLLLLIPNTDVIDAIVLYYIGKKRRFYRRVNMNDDRLHIISSIEH